MTTPNVSEAARRAGKSVMRKCVPDRFWNDALELNLAQIIEAETKVGEAQNHIAQARQIISFFVGWHGAGLPVEKMRETTKWLRDTQPANE